MIGFGSIGKGTLPLIERHIAFDRSKFVVIAPDDNDRHLLDERQHPVRPPARHARRITATCSRRCSPRAPGRGMIVNLSVDTSSVDLMEFCKDIDAFYIDTVVEPWPGLYTDRNALDLGALELRAARELLDLRRRRPGGVTAVSCCGANPGMVSWMVKQALLDIAGDLKLDFAEPQTREDWGRLMQRARRQGHPHRRARHPARPRSQAARQVRQYLVGRGLPVRGPAALRARLGHAREEHAAGRLTHTTSAATRRSISRGRAPARACARGRRPRRPSTAS